MLAVFGDLGAAAGWGFRPLASSRSFSDSAGCEQRSETIAEGRVRSSLMMATSSSSPSSFHETFGICGAAKATSSSAKPDSAEGGRLPDEIPLAGSCSLGNGPVRCCMESRVARCASMHEMNAFSWPVRNSHLGIGERRPKTEWRINTRDRRGSRCLSPATTKPARTGYVKGIASKERFQNQGSKSAPLSTLRTKVPFAGTPAMRQASQRIQFSHRH